MDEYILQNFHWLLNVEVFGLIRRAAEHLGLKRLHHKSFEPRVRSVDGAHRQAPFETVALFKVKGLKMM